MDHITDINQLDFSKVYSYADYLLWKFEERVELLRGKIFKMSPAPSIRHQKISRKLTRNLFKLLEDCPCEFFYAPFDVRLTRTNEENEVVDTVVQPDLCVVCDLEKLADGQSCNGAPDLVIEILSPGNSKKEMKNKYELYEEAGVKEYWIVNPLEENVLIYILKNGVYSSLKPVVDEEIKSVLFPNLKVHTDDIFKD